MNTRNGILVFALLRTTTFNDLMRDVFTCQYEGAEEGVESVALLLNNLQVRCDLPELLYESNNLIDFRYQPARIIFSDNNVLSLSKLE